MYVILVYDFGEKRVAKMLKLCRRYLNWVQNSVFEGEISDVRLKELLMYIKMFMKVNEDSIIIFKTASQVFMERQIIGRQLGSTDNFL
ncbi:MULTISPECIES: CRISPR-associated endonuclease Cas2 [Bacteroidales]|jgi:CRISPR-associated endoribonuclease cas2|uniref:CRISPR-associated endoribonuclease Cas2 n=1 Tax=Coprobacter secundus subsp. similis TaxID=2751153 RepID=A0A7G1HTL1_9BACT|nr:MULTISPECIES: CRISPR-associated endonuclease Cas2 [Bacteroidales]KHM46887.1 CRISPR-associated protein Cas2 [Coprobacter secundus]BCI62870.1 CRISPR-associated endoribonuclease Cas2 [Coprobacter secundus subsp. similis]